MGRRNLLAAVLLVAGCGDDDWAELIERGCSESLFDSVDGVYPTDTEKGCFPEIGPDTPVGDCTGLLAGRSPAVVFLYHRLFGGCPSCDAGFTPGDCRPLVCRANSDCPWFLVPDGDPDETDAVKAIVFECVNELCQHTDPPIQSSDEIDEDDARMACLADVEREGDDYQGEPFCPGGGDTCPLPLPDACRQP